MRLAGYALILLLAIKLASGFSWPALTVPVQRLGLASSLTEAAPFLLLGLGLIFAGGNAFRRRPEVELLVVLQRLLLPLALGYALLAPLVVTDALRAYRGADEQGTVQLQQARQFRRQVVDAVKPVSTPVELARVLQRFPQIRSAINPSQPLESIKKSLFDSLDQAVVTLENRQGDQLSGARVGLLQRTIVTVLLALITAAFLQLFRQQNLRRVGYYNLALKPYFMAHLFEPVRVVGPRRPEQLPGSEVSTGWFANLFRPDPNKPARRPPQPPRPAPPRGSAQPSLWQKFWGGTPPAPRPMRPPNPPKHPRG
ncbi:MAG: hypothetical protein DCF23_06545 [Cyanobium sp.]|nr:MAG: hypothetical protein DCF23_06545 [Cyanobium sp.]